MIASLLVLLLLILSYSNVTGVRSPPPASVFKPTIACLFMVRDESHNIRLNLPLWGPDFFDAYVVAIDHRTIDETWKALEETIPKHIPRYLFNYTFDGFGPARTLVFEKAWEHFPEITHVMVGDPDWKPDMKSIRKSDLANPNEYLFTVSHFVTTCLTSNNSFFIALSLTIFSLCLA